MLSIALLALMTLSYVVLLVIRALSSVVEFMALPVALERRIVLFTAVLMFMMLESVRFVSCMVLLTIALLLV